MTEIDYTQYHGREISFNEGAWFTLMNQPGGQFENVDIETYREQFHPGDHLLVDVREIDEWVLGHIPGAVHIPLNDLPERLAEIPTDKPVVVVCATGGRSLYGSQFLLESGYSQVYNLEGGTMGWLMKRLPIER